MRKLLILLFCLFVLAAGALALDAEITDLTTDVLVEEDGAVQISLTAQVEFTGNPQTFLLPLGTDAKKITVVGWDYDKVDKNGVTCLVLSHPAGFSGTQTFVCSYRLPCQVAENDAGQRFTLALPEAGWEYPIKSYALTINFPVEVTSQPVWSSGYYEDVIDNYLDITVTGTTVKVNSIAEMKDHETILMKLQFEDDSFDLKNLPGRARTVTALFFFLFFLLAPLYWFFYLRYKLILPKAQPMATDTSAGEIPCQLFGDLPDIGGILAHWGNLGYVILYRTARGRIFVRKQMSMGNERTPAEQKLFHAIFRGGNDCDVHGPRFLNAVKNGGKAFRRSWLRRIFHRSSGNPRLLQLLGLLGGFCISLMTFDAILPAAGARWVFLPVLSVAGSGLYFLLQQGICAFYRRRRLLQLCLGGGAVLTLFLLAGIAGNVLFTILAILLQCFCALTVIFGGKRSEAGQELVRRLLGLRRYLSRSQSGELQKLCWQDPQYYYRMRPYAEALGVGRRFSARVGDHLSEACHWLFDDDPLPVDAPGFYQVYLEIFSSLRGEAFQGQSPAPAPRRAPAAAAPRPQAAPRRRPHRSREYDFDE